MVKVTLDEHILWDGRLARVARQLQLSQQEALGMLVTFLMRTRKAQVLQAAGRRMRDFWDIASCPGQQEPVAVLAEAGFLRRLEQTDDAGERLFEIVDNAPYAAKLTKRRAAASLGGKARAAQLSKAKPKRVVAKRTPPKALNIETWDAYAAAYQRKHATAPVDNARNRSLIAQLVQRLGVEAPRVAEFFVQHNDRLYVRSMHALNLAVRDCESLRTQFVTGRRVTDAQARQADEGQGVADQLLRLGGLPTDF